MDTVPEKSVEPPMFKFHFDMFRRCYSGFEVVHVQTIQFKIEFTKKYCYVVSGLVFLFSCHHHAHFGINDLPHLTQLAQFSIPPLIEAYEEITYSESSV